MSEVREKPGLAPVSDCAGFKATVGNFTVVLGYAVHTNNMVLLYAYEVIGPSPPRVWRSFWTTRENAADMAALLADDVEEYLDALGPVRRTSEDLDLDDYVFHIESRMNNGFH